MSECSKGHTKGANDNRCETCHTAHTARQNTPGYKAKMKQIRANRKARLAAREQ